MTISEHDKNVYGPSHEGPFPKKIAFLGCPLDCDEREPAIAEKNTLAATAVCKNPYDTLMALLRPQLPPGSFREIGSMEVPEWLRPVPTKHPANPLSVEAFVKFIDAGGCRHWAEKVGKAVAGILPDIPCFIGIDHSLSAGVIKEISRVYSPRDITLLVLDSHTDAISTNVMEGLIAYDIETNPHSIHDPEDPFLKCRPESFNASTFLLFLIREGIIMPENLFIVGPSDLPPKKALRIKDSRVQRYVESFAALRKRGVKLLTKADIIAAPSKIKSHIASINTPYLYVSVDMDIGARNALEGVRFTDRAGLNESQILAITREIGKTLKGKVALAAMDLCEFNPRTELLASAHSQDRTLPIAAEIIKILSEAALSSP